MSLGESFFTFHFFSLECGVRCKDLSRHVVCTAEAVYERKVVGSLALDIDRGDGAGGSGGSMRTSSPVDSKLGYIYKLYTHTHTHTHICIYLVYIYIYSVCVYIFSIYIHIYMYYTGAGGCRYICILYIIYIQ